MILATVAEGINTGLEAVVTVVFSVLGIGVTVFVVRLCLKWARKASGDGGGAWWNEDWAREYIGEKDRGGATISLWDEDEPMRDPADE